MILIFFLLINDKNIEGQEITSTTPNSTTTSPPPSKNIKLSFKLDNKIIELNVNTNDKISVIKNKLYEKDKVIPLNQLELIYDGIILNDSNNVNYYKLKINDEIQVKNKTYVVPESDIKQNYTKGDIPNMYDKFVKALNDFIPMHKKKKYEIYNDDIFKLFKIKSKPILKPYNSKYNDEYSFLDTKQSSDNTDNDNTDNDNTDSKDNDNTVNDSDNEEKCCYKYGFNIKQDPIVTPMDNITQFIVDRYYIPSTLDTFKPYNKNYYDYMEEGSNKYKYLVGSMLNLKNPGKISF